MPPLRLEPAAPRVSSSWVYMLIFYLAIVNKILRHCHSGLARQHIVFENTIPVTRGSSWSALNEKRQKLTHIRLRFFMQLREHIIPMQQDAYKTFSVKLATCVDRNMYIQLLSEINLINSLPTNVVANSLDPDQARQNVGPDLDTNCLTL